MTREIPLPYRGTFGTPRPPSLSGLALPPALMPPRQCLRPLKAWRYIGIYGPELMICLAAVRIGRARQAFWGVWDRERRRLHERTVLGRGPVLMHPGRVRLCDRGVELDLRLQEEPGIETVCPSGTSYAWTRKQAGVVAEGVVAIDGRSRALRARAVIDDTAGYYRRRTSWRWCAGVGVADDGREVAWNLVSGVNDPPRRSERTVWVAGEAFEPPPCHFATDLSSVDDLRFHQEAVREHRQNLVVIRSFYHQPFGTFSGVLPGATRLAEVYGVMEEHDVRW